MLVMSQYRTHGLHEVHAWTMLSGAAKSHGLLVMHSSSVLVNYILYCWDGQCDRNPRFIGNALDPEPLMPMTAACTLAFQELAAECLTLSMLRCSTYSGAVK